MNNMGEFDDLYDDDDRYEVLEHHEEQAEYARNLFAGFTVIYTGVALLTTFYKPMAKIVPRILINLVFIGLWMYPATELANAAHEGGRLVHQFGARAPLAETVESEDEEEPDEEEPDAEDSEDQDDDGEDDSADEE